MARTALLIGHKRDVFGQAWDVREERPTPHGFSLYFGWPRLDDGEPQRGKGYGGPRLIPTRSLYRYWWRLGMRRDGAIYDLPVGRTAIKRMRRLLGFNLYDLHRHWWMERLTDLHDLSCTDFAKRYEVDLGTVSEARTEFFGRTIRPASWWKLPEYITVLTSNLPTEKIADRLDIAPSSVRRLRATLVRAQGRPKQIIYRNAVETARRDNLVAAGLCTQCSRPNPNPALRRCPTCAEVARQALIESKKKQKKEMAR